MKTASPLLLFAAAISLMGLALQCAPTKEAEISGGTSTEVVGKILEPGGLKPAKNVLVFMRPYDYRPLHSANDPNDSGFYKTTTDDSGAFRFTISESLSNVYCIEGRDDRNNRMLLDSIPVPFGLNHTTLVSAALKLPARIRGLIPPIHDIAKSYVQVLGLGSFALVDTNGYFSLDSLPEGNLRLLIPVARDTAVISCTLAVVRTTAGADTFITPLTPRFYLTLTGSGNGSVIGSDSVKTGFAHAIKAIADSGHLFVGWKVDEGIAALADSSACSTTVFVGNNDASVRAIFRMDPFRRTVGSVGHDEAYSVWQTDDGGYIMTGYSNSFGAGSEDVYLVKTDGQRNVTWSKTYGGPGNDCGRCVRQTAEGGYIIAGNIETSGRQSDVYLIKTNSSGDTVWTKTYGRELNDYGYSVQPVFGGGYIIAGATASFDSGANVYLIKTKPNGDTIWTRTFGGLDDDMGYSVQQSVDSGFVIAGYTRSSGAGAEDVYLIKTDANGNTVWTRTFGGQLYDVGRCVRQTKDGGFIVAGQTRSFGSESARVYLIKTDAGGNVIWTRATGRSFDDAGYAVEQTADEGYVIAGSTFRDSYDALLMKTDSKGDTVWTKAFGGAAVDFGSSIQKTIDGGYIVAGYTESFGAGNGDVLFLKTDAGGNLE